MYETVAFSLKDTFLCLISVCLFAFCLLFFRVIEDADFVLDLTKQTRIMPSLFCTFVTCNLQWVDVAVDANQAVDGNYDSEFRPVVHQLPDITRLDHRQLPSVRWKDRHQPQHVKKMSPSGFGNQFNFGYEVEVELSIQLENGNEVEYE